MFFKTCEKCKSATSSTVSIQFGCHLADMFQMMSRYWFVLFFYDLTNLKLFLNFSFKKLKSLLLPQLWLDFSETSQACSIYSSDTGYYLFWRSLHFGAFYGLFPKKCFSKHVKNVKVLLLPQFPFNLDVTWQICSRWCTDTVLGFLWWFDKLESFNLTFINCKI
jgi:hypothetical protein